jgi:DhnA family fructose-bisphosphate aldolase class Ia
VSKNTADEMVKLVGVISSLGDSSRHTWLKLPFCEDFERVTLATSLPILMLGGPSKEDPRPICRDFAAGMAARSNVRGALVGRNVSFPGPEDPAAVAQAVSDIVHNGLSAEQAIQVTMKHRDHMLDTLTKTIL